MKNIIKVLFIAFFIMSAPSLTNAQEIVVYDKFEDFINKKGTQYDQYTGFLSLVGKFTLKLNHNGQPVKIVCNDKWGFTYNNALFRMDDKKVYRVMSIGKNLCYYEEGPPHLTAIEKKYDNVLFTINGDPISFVSKSPTSIFIPIFSNSGGNAAINKKGTKQLKQDLPEPVYAELFECLNGSIGLDKLRTCSQLFIEDTPAQASKLKSEEKNDLTKKDKFIYFNTSEISRSGTGIQTSKVVKLKFTIGLNGAETDVGSKGKELEKYIKNDPEAYTQFKKGVKSWQSFTTYKIIEYASGAIVFGSFILVFKGLKQKDDGEGVTPVLIGGIAGVAVGAAAYSILRRKADKKRDEISPAFAKACEIYNRNLLK